MSITSKLPTVENMPRRFDLTLTQALAVACGIEAAKAALSVAIMDSTEDATTNAMHEVYDGLHDQQCDLRALIEATEPASVQENDDRGTFLIRQALLSGEGFGVIAELSIEAFRRECDLRRQEIGG